MQSALKILVLVVVIGLIAGGYFVAKDRGITFGGKVDVPTGLQVASEQGGGLFARNTQDLGVNVNSQEILALFGEVSRIEINTNIFSDVAFTSLQDITVQLPVPSSIGRTNPFLPIGTDSAVTSTVSTDDTGLEDENTTEPLDNV